MARLVLLVAILCLVPFSTMAQLEVGHRVLVVYDSGDRMAPIADFDNAFKSVMNEKAPGTAIFREFLNTGTTRNYRVDDPVFEQKLRHWIVDKYGPEQIELIVSLGRIPSNLLPGVPTIYVGQPKELGGGRDGLFVPILSGDEFSKTVEFALKQQPRARNILLVSGTSPADQIYEETAKADLASYAGRFQIRDTTGMSVQQVAEMLGHIASDTIVLMTSVRQDGSGKSYEGRSVAELLAARSAAPIYATLRNYLGTGVVGGYMLDFSPLGDETGKLGAEILGGTELKKLQVPPGMAHSYVFDDRQLKRWGIGGSALPAGSTVLFHEQTLWERHKVLILGVVVLLLGQMALILQLLVHRRRERRARETLRRHQAELEEVSGRLVHARDEERTRIARELHDDLSQRLGLLAMQSEQAERKLDVPGGEIRRILRTIYDQAVILSAEVRRISHELHSTSLEHLGLVPALQRLCEEISASNELQVEFRAPEPEPELTASAAQCLFRVAQESLSNIVKYSGCRTAEVELRPEDERIVLRIRDFGAGFDPAKKTEGLGLVSMRERMRLEGGSFTANSVPGSGTAIEASLPLARALRARPEFA